MRVRSLVAGAALLMGVVAAAVSHYTPDENLSLVSAFVVVACVFLFVAALRILSVKWLDRWVELHIRHR